MNIRPQFSSLASLYRKIYKPEIKKSYPRTFKAHTIKNHSGRTIVPVTHQGAKQTINNIVDWISRARLDRACPPRRQLLSSKQRACAYTQCSDAWLCKAGPSPRPMLSYGLPVTTRPCCLPSTERIMLCFLLKVRVGV